MVRIVLALMFALYLNAETLYVVSNSHFPLYPLSAKQIKNIYLKKITQIDGITLVPLNLASDTVMRNYFEKNFLHRNRYQLKKYWLKAHYKGLRPPKSISTIKRLVRYIQEIDGAIAYVPKSYIQSDMKIHLEIEP